MIRVEATTQGAAETAADTLVIGLLEDEGVAHDVDGALQALVDAGEAKPSFKHVAVTHARGKRLVLVGLGARDRLDGERLRVAAATALARVRELGTEVLCWEVPHHVGDDGAGAVVEGTLLAAHRHDRWKSGDQDPPKLTTLVVSDHKDRTAAVERAVVVAGAVNAARDLQNTPANLMTPTALADAAQALAAEHPALSCEVGGRELLAELGMGAFSAVAQASHEEPRLIVLRHEPDGAARGPVLGLVGKAVTFDTGGISLKPSAKMHEMKFDMSGGAAVLHAVGAIARLGLPVRVVAVVGATENMPGGGAMKPGDVITSAAGLTVEVDNTDAEGRLVLADCLHHALGLGAERLVDVATLTGAVVVALGSTHTGLVADDDAWAAEVLAASERAGEPVHRLPMHEEYADLVKGTYADLTNSPEGRKAGTITAGHFLHRFSGDVPWAHLDIAGTAWGTGKPYARKGGTGVMVRTLVALAEAQAA